MNNPDKKPTLNISSFVNLKAELLRKHEEFRQELLKKNAGQPISKKYADKKSSIWSKKNAGVLERASRDHEEKKEDIEIFSQSKSQLIAKAHLYEKLSKGQVIPENDDEEIFLVDFTKKAFESRGSDNVDKSVKSNNDSVSCVDDNTEIDPDKSEDCWVDYEDDDGHTKTCLKSDLKLMLKKGKLNDDLITNSDMMPSDIYREQLRKKWELEEEEITNNPIGAQHYSNIRYDEIRTHGVGYYEFSKLESERIDQLESLHELRKQTELMRLRKEKIKKSRKHLLKARLAKVKQRKLIRQGIADININTEKSDSEESDEITSNDFDGINEKNVLIRDDSWRVNAPVREWDVGKDKSDSKRKSWKEIQEEQRDERLDDFAPPSFLYDNENKKSKKNFKNHSNVSLKFDYNIVNSNLYKEGNHNNQSTKENAKKSSRWDKKYSSKKNPNLVKESDESSNCYQSENISSFVNKLNDEIERKCNQSNVDVQYGTQSEYYPYPNYGYPYNFNSHYGYSNNNFQSAWNYHVPPPSYVPNPMTYNYYQNGYGHAAPQYFASECTNYANSEVSQSQNSTENYFFQNSQPNPSNPPLPCEHAAPQYFANEGTNYANLELSQSQNSTENTDIQNSHLNSSNPPLTYEHAATQYFVNESTNYANSDQSQSQNNFESTVIQNSYPNVSNPPFSYEDFLSNDANIANEKMNNLSENPVSNRIDSLKPVGIPFLSPYVQKSE